uniref:Uncharacterized protein n=1 Tax=Rhizophora mucronata TaxID=61149 RepID=A0A2P2P288_RHIMU
MKHVTHSSIEKDGISFKLSLVYYQFKKKLHSYISISLTS